MALQLTTAVHAAVLAHARSDPQRETCALLGGQGPIARHFYPVANIASEPARRYRMDPRQQIAALRSMREHGEQLLAIVHSHPCSPPQPSTSDVAEASYPEAVYVIVSLVNPERPTLAAYRLHPGRAPQPVTLSTL